MGSTYQPMSRRSWTATAPLASVNGHDPERRIGYLYSVLRPALAHQTNGLPATLTRCHPLPLSLAQSCHRQKGLCLDLDRAAQKGFELTVLFQAPKPELHFPFPALFSLLVVYMVSNRVLSPP